MKGRSRIVFLALFFSVIFTVHSSRGMDRHFQWELKEPSGLADNGRTGIPAILSGSFNFTAELRKLQPNDDPVEVFLTVDGIRKAFSFDGILLKAEVKELEAGVHTICLTAVSAAYESICRFEFEVLDRLPRMDIGIGLQDGYLYADLERSLAAEELGDEERWNLRNMDRIIESVAVLYDGSLIRLETGDGILLEDLSGLRKSGVSPEVIFHSSLGELRGKLFKEASGVSKDYGCDKGDVGEIDTCFSGDWTVKMHHYASVEGEERKVLDAESNFDGDDDFPWYTPWWECFTYVCVHFNWIGEGHLDPLTNWSAQADTLWYNDDNTGYKGVGYPSYHLEHYPRAYGYYPPSLCTDAGLNYLWEVRIDCYECDPNDPYGYESKGWNMDESLLVDHTCPVFVDSNGIPTNNFAVMPGEELNDYVQDELLPSLAAMGGQVYNGDGSVSNHWDYYWTRRGQHMEDWLQENPGGIVIIVKAEDPSTDQGRFLHHMLSIDMETEPGARVCLDDELMHFYYVDKSPVAQYEYGEPWPSEIGGLHWPPDPALPIDGSPHGEFSCWILLAGCEFLEYESVRLRIKDNCNNWTRSGNFVPADDIGVEITDPDEGEGFNYNEQVVFTAQITGNALWQGLAGSIDWFVVTGQQEWNAQNYSQSGLNSTIQNEPWTGSTFTVTHLRDEQFKVRARVSACQTERQDELTVVIVHPTATMTPTLSPTVTPSPTITDTPFTATETPFYTHEPRPTITPEYTPSKTPTSVVTPLSTPTPTHPVKIPTVSKIGLSLMLLIFFALIKRKSN